MIDVNIITFESNIIFISLGPAIKCGAFRFNDMGLFTKKKRERWEPAWTSEEYSKLVSDRKGKPLKIGDFQVGQVWQMSPGYYTKNPYYFEILLVTEYFIVTNIPDAHGHIFDIRDQGTWNIQTPRMTLVGSIKTHGKLLKNQPLD